MNKINCEKCEHSEVCRYKEAVGRVESLYNDFKKIDVMNYPFETTLRCKAFKEIQLMPGGTFHIEPTPYYGTGTPYPDNGTYITNNSKEGENEV